MARPSKIDRAFAQLRPNFNLLTQLFNLMALLVEAAFRGAWSETVRVAITAGYLGGLTTYSSFNFETTRLLETGATGTAGAYVLATLIGAFVAGWVGMALGRHLFAA